MKHSVEFLEGLKKEADEAKTKYDEALKDNETPEEKRDRLLAESNSRVLNFAVDSAKKVLQAEQDQKNYFGTPVTN
jgi:hypothetical protein